MIHQLIAVLILSIVTAHAMAAPVATRGYLAMDRSEKLKYLGFNSANGFSSIDIGKAFKSRGIVRAQYNEMIACMGKKQTHAIYVEEDAGKILNLQCVPAVGYWAYWNDRVEKLSWVD